MKTIVGIALLIIIPSCAAVALWPGNIPRLIRRIATCVFLTPLLLVMIFIVRTLVTAPSRWSETPGQALALVSTMIVCGAIALWPSDLPRAKRSLAGVGLAAPLLFILCFGAYAFLTRAKLTGKVTFQGEPLPSGKVFVRNDDGIARTGDINSDGSYVVFRVPPGAVKIAVTSFRAPSPGPVPVPTLPYVAIPPRYRDFEKSGLTCMVTRGEQRHDIELEPGPPARRRHH